MQKRTLLTVVAIVALLLVIGLIAALKPEESAKLESSAEHTSSTKDVDPQHSINAERRLTSTSPSEQSEVPKPDEGAPKRDLSILEVSVMDIGGGPIVGAKLASRRPRGHWETGTDGRVRLSIPPGRIFLDVSAQSYTDGQATGIAPGTLEIRLRPGAEIYGRVTLPDGKPVKIGFVNAEPLNEDTHLSKDKMIGDDGNYQIGGLEPGRYRVSSKQPGASAEKLIKLQEAETLRIDLKLEPRASVRGRVFLSDGAPCSTPDVMLKRREREVRLYHVRKSPPGQVLAEAVPPGTYQVQASCDGPEYPQPELIVKTQAIEGLRFEVPAPAQLRCTITNQEGAPVQDATLTAYFKANAGIRDGRSNAEGQVVLSLESGQWDLTTKHRDYLHQRTAIEISGRPIPNCHIQLSKAETLEVWVTSEGKPVDKAQVSSFSVYRETDGSGRAVLSPIKPGKQKITARLPGPRPSREQKKVFTIKPQKKNQLRFEFPALKARIWGDVFDAEGTPVVEADVYAISVDTRFPFVNRRREGQRTRSTDRGNFELRALGEGPYLIMAEKPGYGRVVKTVSPSRSIRLKLGGETTVEGSVLLPDGSPAESFELFLIEEKSFVLRKERLTSAGGTFSLDHIPFGDYVIAAKQGKALLNQQRIHVEQNMGKVQIQLRERQDFVVEIVGSPKPDGVNVISAVEVGFTKRDQDGRFRTPNFPIGPAILVIVRVNKPWKRVGRWMPGDPPPRIPVTW